MNGISSETGIPVKWSQTEGVTWKLAMPGVSGSTPIVWGDRIFLSVANAENVELWSVDRTKGEVLWKRGVSGNNHNVRKGNMSSPSPVTDGKTVWVLSGTGFLKAFDFTGKELWVRDIQKEYGKWGLNHGYGSSPLLYDGSLIVQVLHGMNTDDPSYVLRVDGKTGKTTWKVDRPTTAVHESPDSYTTPMLAKAGGKQELIISGGDAVTGHDLATGKELWRGTGFNPDQNPAYRVIASPTTWEDLVYVPTRIRPLQTFRAGGRGDVTSTHRVFTYQNGPDVPTPISDGKYFYIVNDRGIVNVLDAKTGAEIYAGQRIKPAAYSASPVLVDGRIYITNEEGLTTVLKAGPKFEVVAENPLNDYCLSSPAISDGQIFIRTTGHLYCFGARKKTSAAVASDAKKVESGL